MIGFIWLIVGLLIAGVNTEGGLKLYTPLSNEIILHGRYYMEGSTVKYDWCCFKIDFCFRNSKKIVWNVVDTWNIYHVVIDGKETKIIHPKKDQKITIF